MNILDFIEEHKDITYRYRDWILINMTPHHIKFVDGTIINYNRDLATILETKVEDTKTIKYNGLQFTEINSRPTKDGLELVNATIEHNNSTIAPKIAIIGSVFSVNLYGFPVISPILTKETRNKPPIYRTCLKRKFNTRFIGRGYKCLL